MADTYLKLHDAFPEHRKVVAAGGDAAWLHVCALAYASRNTTDGLIPAGVVPRLSDRKQPLKLAEKLTEVGLWHASGHDCARCPQPGKDEYVIHDYLKHQRSAEKIDEIKAKRRESGSRGGSRKAANARTVATAEAQQSSSNLLDGWQESAEAKGYPDTEEVLRTSRTETEVPPSAGAGAPQLVVVSDPPTTTEALVADWIDHVPKRPPGQVVALVGKHIKAMLAEGIDPADVRRGVASWAKKGLNPAALPSVVNEVMNAAPRSAGPRALSQGRGGSGPYLPEQDYSKVTL